MRAAILPGVERATNVIVNPIIRADWQCVVSRSMGQREEVPMPSWIIDPMLLGSHPGTVTPNTHYMERLSATDFWATFLTHALWYGKGAFVCQVNEREQPIAGTLRLVNPFLIGYRDGEWLMGDPNDPVHVPFDGTFTVGRQRFKLVVMRGLSPNDGIMPEGILQRHWETLGLGVQIRTFIKDAYRFGNQPTGFLTVSTPNFDERDAKALREQWGKAHGNSRRSVAVLNSTVAYSPIQTVSPVDAEAKELAVANIRDIALAFNLDPVYLGTGASGLNYQNQNDRRADLVDLNLSMWGQKLTDALSAVLPYGTRIKINWPSFILPLQPQDPGAENYQPSTGAVAPSDPEG
jgi:HK97 family phage portal protein